MHIKKNVEKTLTTLLSNRIRGTALDDHTVMKYNGCDIVKNKFSKKYRCMENFKILAVLTFRAHLHDASVDDK